MKTAERYLVSVVIIAYNEERNIVQAVRSVQRQSLQSVEIVVVDDCSTDNTYLLVQQLAEHDNRIKAVRLPHNNGMQMARIKGAQLATCRYVAFLDSDDWLEQNAIELMYNRLLETNADIVEMGFRHAVKKIPIRINLHVPSLKYDKIEYLQDEIIDQLLAGKISAGVWSKLYRRDTIRFDEMYETGHELGEDMIFNLRVMRHASKFVWIDYIGYNYCSADANIAIVNRWDDQMRLRSFLLSNETINCRTERKATVAKATLNDLIDNISMRMLNPFVSKKDLRQWIEHEIVSPFWIEVKLLLNDCGCRYDVDEIMQLAKNRLKKNRIDYILNKALAVIG